jgi:hypothetical protein
MALKQKYFEGFMSEQLDIQEPEGNRQGRAVPVFFAVLVSLVLLGIVSWVFVPSVRVLGYQIILIVGPADARWWSVNKLRGYKELAVRPLAIALEDKDESVRTKAFSALREIGPAAAEAVPALIEALKDKDKRVRRYAAEALGEIGPKAEKAVPVLINALKDKDEYVRSNAAFALGKIGKKAVPVLIQALKDKDKSVRYEAAWALGKIGPKAEKAIPALIETLKDYEGWVRRAAKEALKQIQQK